MAPYTLYAHEIEADLFPALQKKYGFTESYLEKIFSDPLFTKGGSPTTKDCRDLRMHITSNTDPEALALGKEFYHAHKDIFREAEKKYGVPPEYILSIIRRETVFGVCFGDFYVLQQLTSVYIHTKKISRRSFALRQIAALLAVAKKENWGRVRLFEIPGSYMGAFGYGHFIPSSRKEYAVDGDGNGTIDLFDPHDAIFSIANYLVIKGWHRNKDRALYAYNRDRRYVAQIKEFANTLKKKPSSHPLKSEGGFH